MLNPPMLTTRTTDVLRDGGGERGTRSGSRQAMG